MLNFITAALMVYGAMHLYVFGKVWRVFPRSSGLALTLVLAGALLTFSPVIVRHMDGQGWHSATAIIAWASYTWMGFVGQFFCIGVALDLGHTLASLLRVKRAPSEKARLQAVSLLALLAVIYGLIEARQIRVEELKIVTPKLASGRITLAQISDLHIGILVRDEFIGRINDRLKEIRPDVVVATGDIVDAHGDGLDALARLLAGFKPPLGAYAVTGNHERFAGLDNALRFLHNAGYTVLRDESVAVGGIILAGEDDPTIPAGDKPRQAATEKPAPGGANDFIVLLKHQPLVENNTRFDLQLSGHIHGGQIFPFGYLTRMVYGVDAGLTRLSGGRLLYVSRGTGTWGPPLRLLAPPEITLITIESEKK